MNKKTSPDTAEGASPAAQAPGYSNESELRPGNSVLTVPECDAPAELARSCDELFPLLTTRPPGTTVCTRAMSPVLEPSLLVWLAGGVREIRHVRIYDLRAKWQTGRKSKIVYRKLNCCRPGGLQNGPAIIGRVSASG